MNNEAVSAGEPATKSFPKHVLMVTGYLWGGGAEWHLLNLAWSLRKMGVAVDVAYVRKGTGGALSVWRRHGFEPEPLCWPWDFTRLNRNHYDVVHAHLFKGEVVGARFAKRCDVPFVITRHSLDWENLPRWQRMVLRLASQRRLCGLIAVSEGVADVCRIAMLPVAAPIQVIQHGIAPELLAQKRIGTDIREDLGLQGCKLIGTVARLSRDKGLNYLLQAYNQARAALGDWHLVIAGDGPEKERMEDLATDLGLAERVHFLGWREDSQDIVESLDIFALPSIREGFGLALLEAMTFGTAAVVSDLPSIRETAGDAAVYVPSQDSESLAGALTQLAEQPQLRAELRQRSIEQASKFSAETMALQTLEFYRTICR